MASINQYAEFDKVIVEIINKYHNYTKMSKISLEEFQRLTDIQKLEKLRVMKYHYERLSKLIPSQLVWSYLEPLHVDTYIFAIMATNQSLIYAREEYGRF
jgi:hypothetical protein